MGEELVTSEIIKKKNYNLFWIIVPDNNPSTSGHYKECIPVLRTVEIIFKKMHSSGNIVAGMLFDEKNAHAKSLAKIFEKEQIVKGSTIPFEDDMYSDDVNTKIKFFVPKNGLQSHELVLMIAPKRKLGAVI